MANTLYCDKNFTKFNFTKCLSYPSGSSGWIDRGIVCGVSMSTCDMHACMINAHMHVGVEASSKTWIQKKSSVALMVTTFTKEAAIDEELICQPERSNTHDWYAVAVMKSKNSRGKFFTNDTHR